MNPPNSQNLSNPLEYIQQLLEQSLPEARVQVRDFTGTQDHLDLLVISDVFKNKPILEQHRLVMDILRQQFQERLHAVKIKTMTWEAYHQQKAL